MGVFWGQCMTKAMQELIDDGIDWVLTIDYDSMFSARHLDEMFGVFGSRPEIDALAPMQTKRQEQHPLFSINNQEVVSFQWGQPFEVDTAHFGLTLIRTEAIKKMQKPWFLASADSSGEWGDGRVDEDIHFWRQFKAAGNSVFITPDVRIGHLEVVCSEFEKLEDGEILYQQVPVNKWKERERERLRVYQTVRDGEPPVSEGLQCEPVLAGVTSGTDEQGPCGGGSNYTNDRREGR
jgi:hypothetical protein